METPVITDEERDILDKLDMRIAREIMGWDIKPYNWHPSNRIQDALEVVEMIQDENKDAIHLIENTRANTLPHAICLSALGITDRTAEEVNAS